MSRQEKCKCARDYGILEHGFGLAESAMKRAETKEYSSTAAEEWMDFLKTDVTKVGGTCQIDVSRIISWLDETKRYIRDEKYSIARSNLDNIKVELDTKLLKCSLGE